MHVDCHNIVRVKYVLARSRRILLRVLSRDGLSKVTVLTAEEIKTYQACIAKKYTLLENLNKVFNDFKLHLEQAGDTVFQNMF